MKPLDQAIGDAFLEGGRRQGMAAGDVWDYVKWQTGKQPDVATFMGNLLHDLLALAWFLPLCLRSTRPLSLGIRSLPDFPPQTNKTTAPPLPLLLCPLCRPITNDPEPEKCIGILRLLFTESESGTGQLGEAQP